MNISTRLSNNNLRMYQFASSPIVVFLLPFVPPILSTHSIWKVPQQSFDFVGPHTHPIPMALTAPKTRRGVLGHNIRIRTFLLIATMSSSHDRWCNTTVVQLLIIVVLVGAGAARHGPDQGIV